MKQKKMLALLLVLVIASIPLAGCKNNEDRVASGRKTRMENNELIVAIGSEPEAGFDSTTGGHGSITKVLFSTLFTRDKELGWTNDAA